MALNQDDATQLLIRWLRHPHAGITRYGYELYIPGEYRQYLYNNGNRDEQSISERMEENIPAFFAAAWGLCLRGIIRPGIRNLREQSTDDGNAGAGYSVTPFGRQWLAESHREDFVPTEPGRFAEMLAPYRDKLGAGFHERAQEALRCFIARAHLACCAMCGASAESILLKMAIKKNGDEEAVLKEYLTAGGRRRVENILLGKARQDVQDEYRGYTTLLKYWRDSAAHGRAQVIGEAEAYTALALLLRFAGFAQDRWNELTK